MKDVGLDESVKEVTLYGQTAQNKLRNCILLIAHKNPSFRFQNPTKRGGCPLNRISLAIEGLLVRYYFISPIFSNTNVACILSPPNPPLLPPLDVDIVCKR